jgi:hypothetical protein
MAADEAHDVSANTTKFPNGRWWVQYVGLHNDKLFICFRNGDCAEYTMPLAEAQTHLAAILASAHPGTYVNLWLKAAQKIYNKAACPACEISANTPTLSATAAAAPTVPLSTNLTIYPIPGSGWLTAFGTGGAFTATWSDPNVPAPSIAFYNDPTDTGTPTLIGIALGSPFAGPTAGALQQIWLEYLNTSGATLPVAIAITP